MLHCQFLFFFFAIDCKGNISFFPSPILQLTLWLSLQLTLLEAVLLLPLSILWHFPCLLLTWLLPVTNSVTSIRYFQLYSFSICSGPSNNLCAALWHISNFVVGEKDGGLHILSSAYACTICTVTVASAKDSKIMLLFSLPPAFSLLLPGCGCAEGIQL